MVNDVQNQSLLETSQMLILQADRRKQLENSLTNFKRDSKTRKTKVYLDRRLAQIQEIRTQFYDDHKQLLFLADTDDDYFTNDFQSLFEESYIGIYCALMEEKEQLVRLVHRAVARIKPMRAINTIHRRSKCHISH